MRVAIFQISALWGSTQVLLVVSLAWLCLILPLWVVADPSPGTDQEGLVSLTQWPMYRGQPSLSGVSPVKFQGALSEAWVFKAEMGIKSSAAISQGKVFIGCDDGKLHALDLQTGKSLWQFETDGAIESSPLVLGGDVFFGSGDGALYRVRGDNGRLVWKYQTDDQILGSPNWLEDPAGKDPRIIVGSYDFRLHCVSFSEGQALWTYETDNYINGTPAIAKGKTVFGGCDALLHATCPFRNIFKIIEWCFVTSKLC